MTASLRVCGMCPHTKAALTIFSSGQYTQGSTIFLVSLATVLNRCLGLFLFLSIKGEKYEECAVERACHGGDIAQEVELFSGSRRVAGSIPPWAC